MSPGRQRGAGGDNVQQRQGQGFKEGDETCRGLTSVEALTRLHDEIEKELATCSCRSHGRQGFLIWLTEAYSHNSFSSTFRWPSILLTIICLIIFVAGYLLSNDSSLAAESLFLFLALCANVLIVGWDTRSYHKEVHKKANLLARRIKETLIQSGNPFDLSAWSAGKFCPQLHLPQSPCITLQWTIRDGNLVNLPAPLLVEGDVVCLCPGTHVPGRCQNLEPVDGGSSEQQPIEIVELQQGDLFVPTADQCPPDFTAPRLRKAVKPTKFIMKETPFIVNLKLALEKSWSRPRTLYDKERHTIVAKYIEQIIIPVIWFIVLFSSFLHYGYLRATDKDITTWANTAIFVVLRPALAIIPLIPLALPTSWLLLNAYGVAHMLHIGTSPDQIKPMNAYNQSLKQTSREFYFEEVDTDIGSDASLPTPANVNCKKICRTVVSLLFNRDGDLWRSANLLQVLGSLTTLCCVDKKGILSWPNPAADKVFFLTTPHHSSKLKRKEQESETSESTSHNITVSSDVDNFSDVSTGKGEENFKTRRRRLDRKAKYVSKSEVLDVTHDPHNCVGLQFDDPEWYRFLPNLKPLGLAVLLNTCNGDIQEEYTQFCDHISCESLSNEAAVPVVNKRCLCELARQIGFTESAVQDYQYLFQVAMFRHVKPEVIQQGKLARSLNIPRLKMPFPHMASAVIKEAYTNTYQLFSQGTGDLVLDACSEFWDGHDLRVLSDIDRKRILDFYHRTSLTAYSMAFSYVPLAGCPDERLRDNYLELPPDSSLFSSSSKTLDGNHSRTTRRSENNNMNLSVLNGSIDHYLSTESLTVKEKTSQIKEKKSTSSSPSCEGIDVDAITSQVNNEVFIGMVTMQYQACPDFVHLVEQLEKACIRFVHFSKENELRSRVFSEKMGLESGWNCHISLLNDNSGKTENPCQSTTFAQASRGSKISLNESSATNLHSSLLRCQSAPSTVNLETSVVKFVEGETVVDIERDESESGDNISVGSSSSSSDDGDQKNSDSSERLEQRKLANISPSPSRVTESTGTDTNTAPIPFDIHNRAKLPKGIENIRPHLEQVDNVPLLVSLFTDCTPQTSTEMISIMQEYGEVVCVLGSSANMFNMPTFLQADASISIEPLYPELCVRQDVIETDAQLAAQVSEHFLTPTELAKLLNSLPCSLSLHREDNVSLHRLIMEARHYMINVRTSLQFFLCCCLSLSLAQLMTSLMFLPPLLSTGHVLWLVCVVLPIMSFSLMGSACDPQVMTIATGKNLNLSRESIFYFLLCYLIKFCPSIFVVVTCFALLVNFSCQSTSEPSDTPGPCWMFIDILKGDNDFIWSSHLLLSQTFVAFLMVIYFMAISIGFVHRCHLIWQRSPLRNRWWVCMSLGLLVAHFLFCWTEISFFIPSAAKSHQLFSAIPLPLAIFGFVWPLILVAVNSLVKRHEIKVYNRQQRRARLEFNTKLGMNSPF